MWVYVTYRVFSLHVGVVCGVVSAAVSLVTLISTMGRSTRVETLALLGRWRHIFENIGEGIIYTCKLHIILQQIAPIIATYAHHEITKHNSSLTSLTTYFHWHVWKWLWFWPVYLTLLCFEENLSTLMATSTESAISPIPILMLKKSCPLKKKLK